MGAPDGNQNAVGNEGGRPALYNSPDELQKAIDDYFTNPPDKKTITIGTGVIELPVFTMAGLAYALGFESRQSMYDYEKEIEFSYIIKRARLRIEGNYEQNLQFNNATGSIFALKNMGWSDSHKIEHSGGVTLNFDSDDAKA